MLHNFLLERLLLHKFFLEEAAGRRLLLHNFSVTQMKLVLHNFLLREAPAT